MTDYISFQDNEDQFCPGTDCDCDLYHRDGGDILPRRYEFWVAGDRTATDRFGYLDHMVESMTELNADEPFTTGEGFVKDLKTGARLDVTELLAQLAVAA